MTHTDPTQERDHLKPPSGGAIVRMYRIGHGDCFLIAFDGENERKPCYVLIDCGYKPGSPDQLEHPTDIKEITADIIATTHGYIDIVVITHEHQDHLIGFTQTNFPHLKIGEVWFAWTEDPNNALARTLREKQNDALAWLIDANRKIKSLAIDDVATEVGEYLELELGEAADQYQGKVTKAAAGEARNPARSVNKKAMKFVVECSETRQPRFLYPHTKPVALQDARSARAFVLGPPGDEKALRALDPVGKEYFGDTYFAHTITTQPGIAAIPGIIPFRYSFAIPLKEALGSGFESSFFREYYGNEEDDKEKLADEGIVSSNAAWRRIDSDWTRPVSDLALALNNCTNNASLVLAFELSKNGKVLLFAADAQAGNWRSWANGNFADDGKNISAHELLGRTVLYKVAHHCSHNATLNGTHDSTYPNLNWMAENKYKDEFTAMVTAVRKWACEHSGWNHPFPAVKEALLKKTDGRVLQTDTDLQDMPPGTDSVAWAKFTQRVSETAMYFDLTIDP